MTQSYLSALPTSEFQQLDCDASCSFLHQRGCNYPACVPRDHFTHTCSNSGLDNGDGCRKQTMKTLHMGIVIHCRHHLKECSKLPGDSKSRKSTTSNPVTNTDYIPCSFLTILLPSQLSVTEVALTMRAEPLHWLHQFHFQGQDDPPSTN